MKLLFLRNISSFNRTYILVNRQEKYGKIMVIHKSNNYVILYNILILLKIILNYVCSKQYFS